MSKTLLVVFFIIIFYIAFILYSDFGDFAQSFSQFRLEFLLPVFGLFLLGKFIKGIRQQVLFKTTGITIPFKKSILLYMAGLSMTVTPGSSGELIKSYYLKKKYGYSISKSFPIVIIEKFYDLLGVTTIILFTLFFIQTIEVTIIIFLVVALIIIIYITINSKSYFLFILKTLGRIPLLKKYISSLNESQEIFQSLTKKRNLAKSWSLSIISLTIDAIAVYLIFEGFNANLDIIFTTFITFSSFLFGILTLLPGGVGITEVSVVGFLTNEGIDLSLATSIMVMTRLIGTWFITAVGFITTKLFLK